MPEKTEIRKKVLAMRRALSSEENFLKSSAITERLLLSPLWQEAKTVLAYVSKPDEVNTWMLIEAAWKSGKTVAVPKVVSNEKMLFSRIDSFDELKPGCMNIPEPVEIREIDTSGALVILPGVAFDEKRNRIGYGGGYYDRFLAAEPGHRTCALAFELAVIDEVPTEETDIKPEMIVTEKRIIGVPEGEQDV